MLGVYSTLVLLVAEVVYGLYALLLLGIGIYARYFLFKLLRQRISFAPEAPHNVQLKMTLLKVNFAFRTIGSGVGVAVILAPLASMGFQIW